MLLFNLQADRTSQQTCFARSVEEEVRFGLFDLVVGFLIPEVDRWRQFDFKETRLKAVSRSKRHFKAAVRSIEATYCLLVGDLIAVMYCS